MNKITKRLFLAVILGQSLGFAGSLHEAAFNGNLEEAKRLIAQGIDVDKLDKSSATALSDAAMAGKTGIVKFLIDNGANANHKEKNGKTPLIRAVSEGHTQTVIELLNHGAQISLRDRCGQTALKLAVKKYPKMVEIIKNRLLENQVEITDPEDLKILDGKKAGSYHRDLAAYGTNEERTAAIEEATGIPMKTVGRTVLEYLDK